MRIAELGQESGLPVATVKYYLREELLQPGAPTAANRAEYDGRHLRRLRLIRILVEVGGLSLRQVGAVLAAIDEGFAAGVFGVPVEQMAAFKQLLEIPDDVAVVSCVTVGRPANDPNWSAASSRATQPRKSLDELVRWE